MVVEPEVAAAEVPTVRMLRARWPNNRQKWKRSKGKERKWKRNFNKSVQR